MGIRPVIIVVVIIITTFLIFRSEQNSIVKYYLVTNIVSGNAYHRGSYLFLHANVLRTFTHCKYYQSKQHELMEGLVKIRKHAWLKSCHMFLLWKYLNVKNPLHLPSDPLVFPMYIKFSKGNHFWYPLWMAWHDVSTFSTRYHGPCTFKQHNWTHNSPFYGVWLKVMIPIANVMICERDQNCDKWKNLKNLYFPHQECMFVVNKVKSTEAQDRT